MSYTPHVLANYKYPESVNQQGVADILADIKIKNQINQTTILSASMQQYELFYCLKESCVVSDLDI